MQYRKVKQIREEISVIGIGCWNFGGDWDSSDDKKTEAIVHMAVDSGINLFDVAPVYGFTHSETVLGRILKEGALRDKVLIASKCGILWDENRTTRYDLSKRNLLWEIDRSLKRLQTDHIDIYQLHWPDPNTPIEETAEALKEIRAAGKIRYVGLSNFAQADAERFEAVIDVHCQQSLYNMLERNTNIYHGISLAYKTEQEVLPHVRMHGQAFLPYSPLFQGLLTGSFNKGKYFSSKDIRNENPKFSPGRIEPYIDVAEKLNAYADLVGRPLNEIAFNWLRRKPEVTSIIAGASSTGQLQKNLNCLTWDMDDRMNGEIEALIAPFEFV